MHRTLTGPSLSNKKPLKRSKLGSSSSSECEQPSILHFSLFLLLLLLLPCLILLVFLCLSESKQEELSSFADYSKIDQIIYEYKKLQAVAMIIPACFSNPNTISGGSQTPQNLTTCIYQTHLFSSPTYLTLTWCKSLYSHSLTLHAPECFSITISLYPSTFNFFKKCGSGSKTIFLTHPHSSSRKIKLIWDFTRTIFTNDSAEPDSSFYIAISCYDKLEFFLGDLHDELIKRIGATHLRYSAQPSLLSRRQHVFGRRSYVSRAQFMGIKHEIGVHCSGGILKVKVDGKTCLVVKRLAWKFRGNEKIFVGATEVEFFWDVFNWVNRDNSSGKNNGHGVFVFQVGDGGVLPEMMGPEKKLMKKSLSAAASPAALSPSPSCSSVLQWAEETSDGCRSSFSSVKSSGSSRGFSLQLYAWRRD